MRAAQRKLKQGDNYHQLVKKFGLQEDQDGIVRCKGCLEYSELRPVAKEPIILPKERPLTLLLVQEGERMPCKRMLRKTSLMPPS